MSEPRATEKRKNETYGSKLKVVETVVIEYKPAPLPTLVTTA